MEKRTFDRGDTLKPLETIDLDKITSFTEMLEAMGQTAFTGRQLGRAFDILTEMFTDTETLVVMTLSGALTVAKQGKIISDLIDRKCIDIIVSTGALLTHGLIEGMGVQHFMAENLDDHSAYLKGYNRVYDTIELETSFQSLEAVISKNIERLFPAITGRQPPEGSAAFCRRLGELFLEQYPEDKNILSSAAKADVPVYIPAFTDSELCIDVALQYIKHQQGVEKDPLASPPLLPFNPMTDLLDYAQRIGKTTKKMSIFTLGGGVPRNWAQQVAPLFDIMRQNGFEVPRRAFQNGVRICPEPVHWGGLSGCTYLEGVSWGKFIDTAKGGKYAEIYAEVTAVFPLLIKAIFEKIDAMKS
ncbi:deoxyhypusine synthase family protein [bacterium]|nr:deoxyhypusine synthase family protein [candidate division CSSED10-310 bacterium]